MNKTTNIFLFLCVMVTLFCQIQTRYFCSGFVDDEYQRIPPLAINDICNKINMSGSLLFIRLTDDAPHQGYSYDSIYDNDASKYLMSRCKSQRVDCSSSVLVSVYFASRKIRISVGDHVASYITHYHRLSIIDRMKGFLKMDDFGSAFNLATDEILKKLPKVIHYSNETKHVYHTPHAEGNHSSGGFVFFFILICLCCVGCCVYAICYQQKQEAEEHMVVTDHSIHLHMEKLLDIVRYKIKTVDPPITNIEQCVICMEELNPYWERDMSQQNTNSSLFISRFACGHYYHTSCLARKSLVKCIMCTEEQGQTNVEPCYRYFNTVTEENILEVIKNFSLLYPRETLITYRDNYKQDVVVIQQVYPSYSPGVIVWVEHDHYWGGGYNPPMYHDNHYHDYGYNEYNNNTNVISTSGGDYGQEMNTVSTTGGGYGGQEMNTVSNTGGDYGNFSLGGDTSGGGGDY